MAVLTFDQVSVGDELPSLQVPLTRADLVRYAGASGDFNPIHWNPAVATAVGLPDVIAHGMLTMALGARVLTAWTGDPGSVLDYSVTFTRPVVVPADGAVVVDLSGVVKKLDTEARTATVAVSVAVQGQRVFGRSIALLRLA